MELVRGLLILLLIVAIGAILLHLADAFAAWYENQGRPTISDVARDVGQSIRGETINTSDYDVWEKSKPYFQPLDIALVVAFLASILGVFIYTRERS